MDEADVMSEKSFSSSSGKEKVNILWFRNGLRLHDNGALMKAAEDKSCKLLPLFIFDGETPTTRQVFLIVLLYCILMRLDVKIEELHTRHCRYNKMAFLLECLEDIDTQLWYHGGRLNLVEGEPAAVIKELSKHFAIQRICFDQVSDREDS